MQRTKDDWKFSIGEPGDLFVMTTSATLTRRSSAFRTALGKCRHILMCVQNLAFYVVFHDGVRTAPDKCHRTLSPRTHARPHPGKKSPHIRYRTGGNSLKQAVNTINAINPGFYSIA